MKRRTITSGEEQEEELQAEQYTAVTSSDTEKHDIDTATADRIFAKALTDLSLNDRTAIEDEIHGVSCMAVEETPHLLDHSLIDFESELHKINPKPAYDKAQQLLLVSSRESSCCYINERKFRLRFLRCELFNVKKAAERFIRYLDFVAEVYGEYALQRPIRMSDFSHEEMSFLREGGWQLLPYRDRSGRRIFASSYYKEIDKVPMKTYLKIIFYVSNACIDSCDTTNNDFNNIESLQKGVIVFAYVPPNSCMESNLQTYRWWTSSLTRIGQAVPARVVCMHLCYPNTELYKIRGKVIGMVSSVFNSRTKIHLGNPIEWQYALQGYGIPTEIIPLSNTGTIKLDNWKKWIKLKKHTEQQEMTVSMNTSMTTPMNIIVECPGSNDVVFRMGKSMNYHPGNIKFQNMIESHLQNHSDRYTTRTQKEAIEIMVIQNIKKEGGRFLKWESDKGWWINMSVDMCVDLNLDIDMDDSNISTMNSIPTGANIDTDLDRNTNENTNENMYVNVKGNENANGNVSLNSNNSVALIKAETEILLKVHNAFLDFKKKIKRAQQKQKQLHESTNSMYVFEQQDRQKRKRSSNNDITTTTTTMKNDTNSGNNSSMCMPFLPNMKGSACGYFFSDTHDSFDENNSTN